VAVLKEVADEERVHAGEFLRVLQELAPDEAKLYAEGAKEVEDMMKKK
jgi:rubrerythrin